MTGGRIEKSCQGTGLEDGVVVQEEDEFGVVRERDLHGLVAGAREAAIVIVSNDPQGQVVTQGRGIRRTVRGAIVDDDELHRTGARRGHRVQAAREEVPAVPVHDHDDDARRAVDIVGGHDLVECCEK